MASLDIITDRDWQLVAEDMFTEMCWPTLSVPTYDTWPTNQFESDSRYRGTQVLGRATSTSELPLIAYEWQGSVQYEIITCQRFRTDLRVAVKIWAAGPSDVDNATAAARNKVEKLWSQLVEVAKKQNHHSFLTQGACGFGSTTAVSGRGTGGDISGVIPIVVSDPIVIPSVQETLPANRFSKDVWSATGTVTFSVWHN